MEKIIIENRATMPMGEVLDRVKSVISQGRISATSKGKQYCFANVWKDGVFIYCDKNKCSDRFVVRRVIKEVEK